MKYNSYMGKKTAKKSKKREQKYYLTNKEFLQEIIKYRKSGVVSEILALMFQQLAEKISNRSNFYRYTFKEEMVSEAILTCLKYIDSFNPEVSKNPFSYFTTTIFHSFVGFINEEKKQSMIKYKLKRIIDDGNRRIAPKRIKYNEEGLDE